MDIWQVKYVRIGDLIPNAKNPRKISKEKLERLQDKIQRLGFHNPVKTDENLNVGWESAVKSSFENCGERFRNTGYVSNPPPHTSRKRRNCHY